MEAESQTVDRRDAMERALAWSPGLRRTHPRDWTTVRRVLELRRRLERSRRCPDREPTTKHTDHTK